jgi:16S rRNA (guanine(966)-N(2))-methyltransferase RsmD
MRVIAGKFRSRQLGSLRGLDIRPTSDRLRETLFNVLTAGNPDALAGSVWLDLFAGTGAVGIEALSRGAEKVYFVETSRRAVELIKRNLQSVGISNGFEILQEEVLREIPKLERQGRVKPSFIFLDPPYSSQNLYRETLTRLANSVSSEDALVIVEHDKKFDPGAVFGALRRIRKLEQGDAGLSFYRHER